MWKTSYQKAKIFRLYFFVQFTLTLHFVSVYLSFVNSSNFNFYFLFEYLVDVVIKVDLKNDLEVNIVEVLKNTWFYMNEIYYLMSKSCKIPINKN